MPESRSVTSKGTEADVPAPTPADKATADSSKNAEKPAAEAQHATVLN